MPRRAFKAEAFNRKGRKEVRQKFAKKGDFKIV